MKLATIILLFFYINISAQTEPDTIYQCEITTTVSSLVSSFDQARYPEGENDIALGYGFFVRGMWHPARLLSVGIMTGYCQISKDEFIVNDNELASAVLSAVPLQLVVSMQSKRFEFGLGMGPYLIISTIKYGTEAQGRRYELGMTFLGSYLFSLNDNIYVGPELRVLYLSYRGILSFNPSLFIRFEIFRY